MIYGVIYLLIDGTNDREYVGQTILTVEERFKGHMRGNQYIDAVIRKRGADLFATAVLKVCYNKAELDFWEKHFIKSRDTKAPNGYNLTDGGEGVVGWTDEMRKRVSAALTGRPKSAEHCAKLSAARKGKPLSPEHCAKLSLVRRGKKRSAETRANISAALTGLPKSAEHRAHLSEAKKGTHATDEARDKMSAAHLGKKLKPRSAEDRANISAKNRSKIVYPNLVAELDARQMTYSDLAKLLGLKTIGDKMSGRRKFTDEQCAKLVEIFGKTIEYLLERDENFCAENSPHRRPSPYKNLIAELDARQMTYADLARRMGADPRYIARKIRGVNTFSDREKNLLSEIFGKQIEYLLQRDDS